MYNYVCVWVSSTGKGGGSECVKSNNDVGYTILLQLIQLFITNKYKYPFRKKKISVLKKKRKPPIRVMQLNSILLRLEHPFNKFISLFLPLDQTIGCIIWLLKVKGRL